MPQSQRRNVGETISLPLIVEYSSGKPADLERANEAVAHFAAIVVQLALIAIILRWAVLL